MSARYITTTLPYVNADPHLGHALEFIEADCLARSARLKGDDVFFNIGADEHGTKVAQKAEEEGKTPQSYADEHTARLKSFADQLGISYNSFVRTTDPAHMHAAQEFWKRCAVAGDIYKAAYEIKYCVGCELEKTDSELVDGCCPLHPNTEIEIREEENYYFRFSKYKDALLKHCAEQQDFVLPKERMNEITSFVTAGLKDFSISRRREKMSWGIPVPDDDEHVMYVWFDALVNYISAIGWPDDKEKFNKWWPATQLAGKDNLRQQTAMWQAMLLSAELPLSRQIFIHGFITSGGQKMSKTLRNVINPIDLIEKYGVDTVRYILLRHANPFEDSDLTIESIHNYYTDHLVNGLGNLVARVMKLAEEHLQGPVAMPPQDFQPDAQFVKKIEEFRFNEALDYIWEKIAVADNYMTTSSPYKKVKMDEEYWQQKGREDIFKLVGDVGIIAVHLQSVMPKTAKIILAAILANKKPENLFPRI